MRYLVATSAIEATQIAERRNWRWPEWKYVGNPETLRGLSRDTVLYVPDFDRVSAVIARLRGDRPPTWFELYGPVIIEAQRRGMTIHPVSEA